MGAAAYNRGSAVLSREADRALGRTQERADRQALKDEAERLRAQLVEAQRDLARARRCIAELRSARDARNAEHRAKQSASDFAIRTLTRIAFPGDLP